MRALAYDEICMVAGADSEDDNGGFLALTASSAGYLAENGGAAMMTAAGEDLTVAGAAELVAAGLITASLGTALLATGAVVGLAVGGHYLYTHYA